MNDDEFFAEADQLSDSVDTDKVGLATLLDELVQLDSALQALDLEREELTRRQNELRAHKIPELMKELGTEVFRSPETGYAVQLELAVSGALPRDREKKQAILDALKPLGIDEITNDTVEFRFTPGDNEVARVLEFAEANELPCERSMSVHPSRFKAWLKEQIEAGKGAEVAEAGVWHGRHARLVKPRGTRNSG